MQQISPYQNLKYFPKQCQNECHYRRSSQPFNSTIKKHFSRSCPILPCLCKAPTPKPEACTHYYFLSHIDIILKYTKMSHNCYRTFIIQERIIHILQYHPPFFLALEFCVWKQLVHHSQLRNGSLYAAHGRIS